MNIIEEIDIVRSQMNQALKALRPNGDALAKAEKEYKIQLRLAVLRLKSEGTPATLIPLIVYGEENIADLREKRDVAENVLKASYEALNVKKLEGRMLDDQYKEEFRNA